MHKIFSYNKQNLQTIEELSFDELQNENKIWIDIENPTSKEISWIQDTFNIDDNIFNQYLAGSKKSQIRILEEYTFTSIVNVKFKNLQTLTTQSIYMLLIENYEQLLTAIEIALTDFEERSLYNYSIEVLRKLKDLSHQLIMLRRYFWKVREIFSFLIYQEQEIEAKQNMKYLKILYNNVDELVHLIESHKDTINSIRELYIANVSLQMNDTVKTLTIFSAILLPLSFITSFYGMNGVDLNNFSNF